MLCTDKFSCNIYKHLLCYLRCVEYPGILLQCGGISIVHGCGINLTTCKLLQYLNQLRDIKML